MKYKYIIVLNDYGNLVPIIFPTSLIHKEVGRSFRCFNAGFVWIDVKSNFVQVEGESTSLGLTSSPEDNNIIRKFLDL